MASKKQGESSKTPAPDDKDETDKTLGGFPKQITLWIIVYSVSGCLSSMRSPLFTLFLVEVVGRHIASVKTVMHTPQVLGAISYPVAALLADSYLGHYKQTVIFSFVLIPIFTIIPIAAVFHPKLPTFTLCCISFISSALFGAFLATSLTPLMGDQFILPQQTKQLTKYFFISYWASNIGMLVGTFMGPFLRTNLSCFGREDCYPLPLMGSAFALLLDGTFLIVCAKMFKKLPPEAKNVFKTTFGIIYCAIKERKHSNQKKDHWLDYADTKYEKSIIEDIKRLKVLVLLIPSIINIMLIVQEWSTWIYQANNMNTRIASWWTMDADQIEIVNMILCIMLIPLFTYVIFPFLEKKNMQSVLKRIGLGIILYTVGWFISACIWLRIEANAHPDLIKGEAQFRFYNAMNCPLKITDSSGKIFSDSENKLSNIDLEAAGFYKNYKVPVSEESTEVPLEFQCTDGDKQAFKKSITLVEKKLVGFVFRGKGEVMEIDEKFMEHSESRNPLIRTLLSVEEQITVVYHRLTHIEVNDTEWKSFPEGVYNIQIDDDNIGELEVRLGGMYLTVIKKTANGYDFDVVEVQHSNSVHVVWMLPQYVMTVLGEISYTVAYDELLYTQSPVSMKGCAFAARLFADGFGESVIGLLESSIQLPRQSQMVFLYASMSLLNVFLFMFLAYKYIYVEDKNKTGDEELKRLSNQ